MIDLLASMRGPDGDEFRDVGYRQVEAGTASPVSFGGLLRERPAGAGSRPVLAGSQHTPRGHKEADEGLRPLDPQTVRAEARKDRSRRVRRDG